MDIAKRQEISEKYLESIVSVLSKQKFVKALRGKGGGYRLVRTPAEYTIGSILRITEGSMAPVACLDDHPNQCERASSCKTLQMWEGFYKLLNEYFDGITLEGPSGAEHRYRRLCNLMNSAEQRADQNK